MVLKRLLDRVPRLVGVVLRRKSGQLNPCRRLGGGILLSSNFPITNTRRIRLALQLALQHPQQHLLLPRPLPVTETTDQ